MYNYNELLNELNDLLVSKNCTIRWQKSEIERLKRLLEAAENQIHSYEKKEAK